MRASNSYLSSGSQAGKIAIVTALHIGVALALINMKVFKPALPPLVVKPITQNRTVVVPPPVVDADTTTKEVLPDIFVPKTEVAVAPPPPFEAPFAKTLPPGPPPIASAGGNGEKTVPGPALPALPRERTYNGPVANASDCVRPDYPARAAREGLTGTVTLALLVGIDGKVADARIDNTSGSKELDNAAVAALKMCKFKAARANGVPEAAWTRMAYVWSLD